jgi:hypothetical protein
MDAVTQLVRWDVPFAQAHYPSVSLITEKGGDAVTLIIGPAGIDKYPKYRVRFDKVIALLCYEEALMLGRDYRALTGIEASVCAYLWIDSPWLRDNRSAADLFKLKDLKHYLVFGGDSIVELVASGEPKIEQIDKRTVFETPYEV